MYSASFLPHHYLKIHFKQFSGWSYITSVIAKFPIALKVMEVSTFVLLSELWVFSR